MTAIATATTTTVQKIAITKPMTILTARAAAAIRTTPASAFRTIGVRSWRASILVFMSLSVPRGMLCSKSAAALVVDALQVLEPRFGTRGPAVEAKTRETVAAYCPGARRFTRVGAAVFDQENFG